MLALSVMEVARCAAAGRDRSSGRRLIPDKLQFVLLVPSGVPAHVDPSAAIPADRAPTMRHALIFQRSFAHQGRMPSSLRVSARPAHHHRGLSPGNTAAPASATVSGRPTAASDRQQRSASPTFRIASTRGPPVDPRARQVAGSGRPSWPSIPGQSTVAVVGPPLSRRRRCELGLVPLSRIPVWSCLTFCRRRVI